MISRLIFRLHEDQELALISRVPVSIQITKKFRYHAILPSSHNMLFGILNAINVINAFQFDHIWHMDICRKFRYDLWFRNKKHMGYWNSRNSHTFLHIFPSESIIDIYIYIYVYWYRYCVPWKEKTRGFCTVLITNLLDHTIMIYLVEYPLRKYPEFFVGESSHWAMRSIITVTS